MADIALSSRAFAVAYRMRAAELGPAADPIEYRLRGLARQARVASRAIRRDGVTDADELAGILRDADPLSAPIGIYRTRAKAALGHLYVPPERGSVL